MPADDDHAGEPAGRAGGRRLSRRQLFAERRRGAGDVVGGDAAAGPELLERGRPLRHALEHRHVQRDGHGDGRERLHRRRRAGADRQLSGAGDCGDGAPGRHHRRRLRAGDVVAERRNGADRLESRCRRAPGRHQLVERRRPRRHAEPKRRLHLHPQGDGPERLEGDARSGGAQPVPWTSGALPPGMSFSSAGVLFGTPSIVGTFNVTVTATDANGCTQSATLPLTVTTTCAAAMTISAPAIAATAGTAMPLTTLSVSNAAAPVTWSVVFGALPPGLTLSAGGVLSGTPTQSGA